MNASNSLYSAVIPGSEPCSILQTVMVMKIQSWRKKNERQNYKDITKSDDYCKSWPKVTTHS